MHTIVSSSFKGGVGKTSLLILIGNALAASGRKILFLDLDHQLNTTHYHLPGLDTSQRFDLAKAITHNDLRSGIMGSQIVNTDIVPGSFRILDHRFSKPETLVRLVSQVADDYDVCLIDCPPSLDNMVVGAWLTADTIITPLRTDSFDLEGIRYFSTCVTRESDFDLDSWIPFINFYQMPKESEQYTLPIVYGEAIERSLPRLSSIRIPRASVIAKAIHFAEPITPAKKYAKVYQPILKLASAIIGNPVVPQNGWF